MSIWNPRANVLFLEALELPAGPLRDTFVDSACGNETDLRAEVLSLLSANDESGDFLSSPADTLLNSAHDAKTDASPGNNIGPYRLIQEIGAGGMGVVFAAEQLEPVRRTVALKILKG